jgi:hypothetical protein
MIVARLTLLLALLGLAALGFLGARDGSLEAWVSGDTDDGPLRLSGWPRELSWDDFQNLKFAPAGQPQYAARIRSGFGLPPDTHLTPIPRNDGWSFEHGTIYVQMMSNHSWVAEEHRSDRVLEHEQMHFDITGLAAQEWLEALRAVDATSPAEAVAAGRASFDRIQEKLRLVQRLFDHADRGRPEAHAEWRDRLTRLMRSGGRLPEPGELPGFSALGS